MAATCLNMLPAIGAQVSVRFEKVLIDCLVADVKNSWGKPRLLIRPQLGSGEQWVELDRVARTKATTALERTP